jgi:hypothetical protein
VAAPIKRFQQFANVAAIGGFFTKVDDKGLSKPVLVHDDQGGSVCSSLSASGGECRTEVSRFQFNVPLGEGMGLPVIQARRVTTSTQTSFAAGGPEPVGAVARCEIQGPVTLLNGGIEIVGNLEAKMTSQSLAKGEPDIAIVVTSFPDIVIGDATIKTTIDTSPFDGFQKKGDLKREYYKNKQFREKFGKRFNASSGKGPDIPEFEDDIIGSIAQVKIENQPRDVVIEENGYSIIWPGIGKIIVGEVFVNKYYRRLTLLRFLFGSPFEGDLAMGDMETDGHTYP